MKVIITLCLILSIVFALPVEEEKKIEPEINEADSQEIQKTEESGYYGGYYGGNLGGYYGGLYNYGYNQGYSGYNYGGYYPTYYSAPRYYAPIATKVIVQPAPVKYIYPSYKSYGWW